MVVTANRNQALANGIETKTALSSSFFVGNMLANKLGDCQNNIKCASWHVNKWFEGCCSVYTSYKFFSSLF